MTDLPPSEERNVIFIGRCTLYFDGPREGEIVDTFQHWFLFYPDDTTLKPMWVNTQNVSAVAMYGTPPAAAAQIVEFKPREQPKPVWVKKRARSPLGAVGVKVHPDTGEEAGDGWRWVQQP